MASKMKTKSNSRAILLTTDDQLLPRQMRLKLLMPAVPLEAADLVNDTKGVCKEDVHPPLMSFVYWELLVLLLRLCV